MLTVILECLNKLTDSVLSLKKKSLPSSNNKSRPLRQLNPRKSQSLKSLRPPSLRRTRKVSRKSRAPSTSQVLVVAVTTAKSATDPRVNAEAAEVAVVVIVPKASAQKAKSVNTASVKKVKFVNTVNPVPLAFTLKVNSPRAVIVPWANAVVEEAEIAVVAVAIAAVVAVAKEVAEADLELQFPKVKTVPLLRVASVNTRQDLDSKASPARKLIPSTVTTAQAVADVSTSTVARTEPPSPRMSTDHLPKKARPMRPNPREGRESQEKKSRLNPSLKKKRLDSPSTCTWLPNKPSPRVSLSRRK